MRPIEELLHQLAPWYRHRPEPPATEEELAAFEARVGWKLDPEMRAFYRHCNGAVLFKNEYGYAYKILPLAEVVPKKLTYGADIEGVTPERFYEICYLEGDSVVLDIGRQENGRFPLIDAPLGCFYKPEYCEQIASSFVEFLDQALCDEVGGFWLRDADEEAARKPPDDPRQLKFPFWYLDAPRSP